MLNYRRLENDAEMDKIQGIIDGFQDKGEIFTNLSIVERELKNAKKRLGRSVIRAIRHKARMEAAEKIISSSTYQVSINNYSKNNPTKGIIDGIIKEIQNKELL